MPFVSYSAGSKSASDRLLPHPDTMAITAQEAYIFVQRQQVKFQERKPSRWCLGRTLPLHFELYSVCCNFWGWGSNQSINRLTSCSMLAQVRRSHAPGNATTPGQRPLTGPNSAFSSHSRHIPSRSFYLAPCQHSQTPHNQCNMLLLDSVTLTPSRTTDIKI